MIGLSRATLTTDLYCDACYAFIVHIYSFDSED